MENSTAEEIVLAIKSQFASVSLRISSWNTTQI